MGLSGSDGNGRMPSLTPSCQAGSRHYRRGRGPKELASGMALLILPPQTYRPQAAATGREEWRGASKGPRAGDGIRTRDPKLGKLVLYQLSYSRVERPQ